MKRNNYNNLIGNSAATKPAGAKRTSTDRRGIILDEIPRLGPGISEIVGAILGRDYDPDIAQNKIPGWMNMPKREQNTAPAAETQTSTPSARRTPQAPQFGSIRELADNLRKQANEAAARFGTMTPPFNPNAGLPAENSGGVNPQLPGAAAPQQNMPRFTSFRQLAEHLKQQAYDELSGATIVGRLNTGGSPTSNGQPFYGAATHNSFRPPIMKDPETIRQLAERLRREAAGEARNSFTPLDTTPQNTEGNGIGAENVNNYSPVMARESSASENPYRMMRNGESTNVPRVIMVSKGKNTPKKPSETGGTDKGNNPQQNNSTPQICDGKGNDNPECIMIPTKVDKSDFKCDLHAYACKGAEKRDIIQTAVNRIEDYINNRAKTNKIKPSFSQSEYKKILYSLLNNFSTTENLKVPTLLMKRDTLSDKKDSKTLKQINDIDKQLESIFDDVYERLIIGACKLSTSSEDFRLFRKLDYVVKHDPTPFDPCD